MLAVAGIDAHRSAPLCCCCCQVPLVNVALIRTAGLHRLVPAEDRVYQLLLLVEAAVPAAVTLLVVCGRVYPDIRPLSQMLFWQYVASLVTLPAFLVWFMYMLDL
jgi:predicted permease